ncbi:MAG: type III pantothenate kinase, partial [Rickettsiales bacterium]
FGIFIKNIFQHNNISDIKLTNINICSVVPEIDDSIKSACIKYFKINPFFLNNTSQFELNLKYANQSEIGADRIATSIGAISIIKKQNIIIVDMGTATTIDAVTKNNDYLGGSIICGVKTSIKSLSNNTSKLPSIKIRKPKYALGKSTKENMEIGSYYGHMGSIKELISYISRCAFDGEDYKIIATGGFSELYHDENIFDIIEPMLIFYGLIKF